MLNGCTSEHIALGEGFMSCCWLAGSLKFLLPGQANLLVLSDCQQKKVCALTKVAATDASTSQFYGWCDIEAQIKELDRQKKN